MKPLFSAGNTEAVSLKDLENPTPFVPEVAPEVAPEVNEPVITETKVPPVTTEPVVTKAPETQTPNTPPTENAQPVVKEPVFDDIKSFLSKQYGIDSEESLKGIIANSSKVKDLETIQRDNQELKEKYEILLSQADPMSFFSNEEAYKLEQFRKAYPDKDPSVAMNVFTKDLKSVDDFSILQWGYKLDYPNLKNGEEGIKETIAEEFNVDPSLDLKDWPVSAQNRLTIKAADYRKRFDEMRQIEGPKRIDVESIRKQIKEETESTIASVTEGWNKAKDGITNDFQKIKVQVNAPKEGEVAEFFEWETSQLPADEVTNIVNSLISTGVSPTPEAISQAKEAVRLAVMDKNLPKIISAIKKDAVDKAKLEFLKDSHNPDPFKETERPSEDAEKAKKELTNYVLSGEEQKWSRKKLI